MECGSGAGARKFERLAVAGATALQRAFDTSIFKAGADAASVTQKPRNVIPSEERNLALRRGVAEQEPWRDSSLRSE
jgi:hypothetical protein